MRLNKTRTTVEYETFVINGKTTIIANLIPFPTESAATCHPHHAAAPVKGKGRKKDIKPAKGKETSNTPAESAATCWPHHGEAPVKVKVKEKAVETAPANDDTEPAGVKRSEVYV